MTLRDVSAELLGEVDIAEGIRRRRLDRHTRSDTLAATVAVSPVTVATVDPLERHCTCRPCSSGKMCL